MLFLFVVVQQCKSHRAVPIRNKVNSERLDWYLLCASGWLYLLKNAMPWARGNNKKKINPNWSPSRRCHCITKKYFIMHSRCFPFYELLSVPLLIRSSGPLKNPKFIGRYQLIKLFLAPARGPVMQINEFTERIGLHATFIKLTAKLFDGSSAASNL